jgi:hypothetical protein
LAERLIRLKTPGINANKEQLQFHGFSPKLSHSSISHLNVLESRVSNAFFDKSILLRAKFSTKAAE